MFKFISPCLLYSFPFSSSIFIHVSVFLSNTRYAFSPLTNCGVLVYCSMGCQRDKTSTSSLMLRTNKLARLSLKIYFRQAQIFKPSPDFVFTTLYFLHNLRMGQISQSVCPWQSFLAKCNATP